MSPIKPTREDAARASDQGEMYEEALSPEERGQRRRVAGKGRKSVGGAEENRRHPPHVTENAEDAPLQQGNRRPGDIAPLPANASGSERIDLEADPRAEEIDPESAYNRRPGEDKDRPPSGRVDDRPSSPVD
jgi:hypothetical protein